MPSTAAQPAGLELSCGRYRLHVTSGDEQHLVAHYRPNACAQRTALACDDPSCHADALGVAGALGDSADARRARCMFRSVVRDCLRR